MGDARGETISNCHGNNLIVVFPSKNFGSTSATEK